MPPEEGGVVKDPGDTCRLYGDLSWLWPLWGEPAEYAPYCRHVTERIREHAEIPVRTLLDIGCGGGKNVFNLKRDFETTGLDASPAMLALARELNPGCAFVRGDMRDFDLGRTFDAVLVDDAIAYMTTPEDLREAFACAFRHLAPGGVMVVNPDELKETFVQNRTSATPGTGRSPRGVEAVFVENDYDPDPEDDVYEASMVYLIREDGRLRVETDRHLLGLFTIDLWRETLTGIGFRIHESAYMEDSGEYVTFACARPR